MGGSDDLHRWESGLPTGVPLVTTPHFGVRPPVLWPRSR